MYDSLKASLRSIVSSGGGDGDGDVDGVSRNRGFAGIGFTRAAADEDDQ